MSKKRLEEIRNRMIVEKQHFKYLNSEKGYWENVYTILEQDMKYLFDTIIEQDERVQELEEKYYNLKESAYETQMDFLDANKYRNIYKQQNKRYREALEAIAYFEDKKEGEVVTRIDVKYIARKALEGEE